MNYKTIDTQLASFGLQIADACKRHQSNVFACTDSLIKRHPFRLLIEWKLLEHSFNPFKKSAEEQYFAGLAELAVAPVELEFESLTSHMSDITAVRNNLLTTRDSDSVDCTFFGALLKKLKSCAGPANDPRSMEWTILAVKWEQALTTDPKSLPWNTLKMEVDKAAMEWGGSSGQKRRTPERPRLTPQTPPGVVLYTWEQVQDFGYAAMEAAAAGSSYAGV
eukprot:535405-Rhodomonas_salina.1